VLIALTRRLSNFGLATGHRLLVAPSDVRLFEHTVCQPDLLLIHRDRREIVQHHTIGTPDLAVEILSKSSLRRDRALKLEIYARAGLPEYWIVDPKARSLELCSLAGESYRVLPHSAHRATSLRFPDLELDLEALWDEVDRLETGRLPG
jgi:Uma2 family endonuclease